MKRCAIVLCGGKSSRMGTDKAALPFGAESLATRVVGVLRQVVALERIVVVAAAEQRLPRMPAGLIIARDLRPERGPLEGIAAGLRAAAPLAECAFVTACDVPLLRAEFVARLFIIAEAAAAEGFPITVPGDEVKCYPLTGVYHTEVLPAVERRLAADQLRVRDLFQDVPTRYVPLEDLRDVDPELASLENVNHPQEYRRALNHVGLE